MEKVDLHVEYYEHVVSNEEEGEQIDYRVSVGDDVVVDGEVVGVEIEVDYVHTDLFCGLAEFQNSFVVHVVLAEHTDDTVAYEKYSFETVDFPCKNAAAGCELVPVGDYVHTVDYLADSDMVFVDDAPAFDIHIFHTYSVHARDGPEMVEFAGAYLP